MKKIKALLLAITIMLGGAGASLVPSSSASAASGCIAILNGLYTGALANCQKGPGRVQVRVWCRSANGNVTNSYGPPVPAGTGQWSSRHCTVGTTAIAATWVVIS